jgi:putative membrane protein
MNTKSIAALVAGTTLVAMSGLASAQSNVRISADGRPERLFRTVSGLNMHDKMALHDAAVSNMMEIKTSELALRYGQSAWTKQFAKEMVMEHQAAMNELKLLANEKGQSLPQELPMKHRLQLDRLAAMRGGNFDRAYREIQLAGHSETSTKFQSHMKAGRDQDVRSYIVKMLPAVKMHYRMALMKKTMMGATKMKHNM